MDSKFDKGDTHTQADRMVNSEAYFYFFKIRTVAKNWRVGPKSGEITKD
jgi:hypothetical protein